LKTPIYGMNLIFFEKAQTVNLTLVHELRNLSYYASMVTLYLGKGPEGGGSSPDSSRDIRYCSGVEERKLLKGDIFSLF